MDEFMKVLWQLTLFTWKFTLFIGVLVLGLIAGILKAKI